MKRGFKLVDLADDKAQNEFLTDFRLGKKRVCVATEVMEEGVDIPAINLVIRFDDVPNFRSFIQSRGRARQFDSKYVTIHSPGDASSHASWRVLEEEMKLKLAAERRQLEAEIHREEMEELSTQVLRVDATG